MSSSVPARSESPEALVQDRDPRFRRAGVLVPLIALVLLWICAFCASGAFASGANGKTLGGDFAILLAGSQVLHDGGNPYDPSVLYRAESALLRPQAVAAPTSQPFIRVGNPPLFFWALQPFARLPFREGALLWIVAMEALIATGCLALLRSFGWHRRGLPLLLFLAMPQSVLAAYYGNVDGLIFAAIGCSLALLKRSPYVAGCLLSLAWLKPQVGLPIALLILLFHAPARARVLAGFGSAAGALMIFTGMTTGWHSLALWLRSLVGYTHDIAIQPDMASLAGLYIYWTSPALRLGLEIVILGVAGVVTGIWWLKLRWLQEIPFLSVGWLWIVWFLAAPFAHFHDEILLAVPLLALLGPDGRSISERWTVVALYAVFLSLLLFPTARLHTDLQAIMLVPAAVALYLKIPVSQAHMKGEWSSL